jgi:hypothetical protein
VLEWAQESKLGAHFLREAHKRGVGAQDFVRRGALEAKCAQAKGERALLFIVSFLQVGKSKQRQRKGIAR